MRFAWVPCVLLLAACATGGASRSPSTPRAQLEQEFSIALGESIPLDGTPYTVEFKQVLEDSRCAAGVACVWEGNARIGLDLKSFEHWPPDSNPPRVEVSTLSVELNTSSRFPTKDPGTGLIMEIRRLEPTPRADTPTRGYVVTLFARKP